MKKILLITLLAVILTGCSTKPQRIVVTEEKLVYVPIPKKYLSPCKTTRPIDKKEYLEIKIASEKETLLANNIISLHKDIHICNEQIKAIAEFNNKQIELMKK